MINLLALRLACPADVCLEDVGGWYAARRDASEQAAWVFMVVGISSIPSVWSAVFLAGALSFSVGAYIVSSIGMKDLLSRASSSMLEAQHAIEACLGEYDQ